MFCKKCGAEIAENARFCPSCGFDQSNAEKEESQKSKKPIINLAIITLLMAIIVCCFLTNAGTVGYSGYIETYEGSKVAMEAGYADSLMGEKTALQGYRFFAFLCAAIAAFICSFVSGIITYKKEKRAPYWIFVASSVLCLLCMICSGIFVLGLLWPGMLLAVMVLYVIDFITIKPAK